MARYCTVDGNEPQPEPEPVKPGVLWVQFRWLLSADPQRWAHERGIPPEDAVDALQAYAQELKARAIEAARASRD
jgi:hypothetical protein